MNLEVLRKRRTLAQCSPTYLPTNIIKENNSKWKNDSFMKGSTVLPRTKINLYQRIPLLKELRLTWLIFHIYSDRNRVLQIEVAESLRTNYHSDRVLLDQREISSLRKTKTAEKIFQTMKMKFLKNYTKQKRMKKWKNRSCSPISPLSKFHLIGLLLKKKRKMRITLQGTKKMKWFLKVIIEEIQHLLLHQ